MLQTSSKIARKIVLKLDVFSSKRLRQAIEKLNLRESRQKLSNYSREKA